MRSEKAGFSLVELIVVMALMSMVIAVIPAFRSWSGTARANAVVRTLASDLRWARSTAVDRNHDVIVTFNITNHSYSVFDDVDRDGPDVGDLIKSVTLRGVGEGAMFSTTSAYAVGGGAISSAVSMGSTSDPIAVTFKASGEAINFGTAYVISTLDTAPSRKDRNRAVQILKTGRVGVFRWKGSTPTDPWVEHY